jgi:protein-tyrosine phosphatase
MTGFSDIHTHVLAGIDDGPDDLEGSVEMLRAAADSGIVTIASTPHLRSDFPNVHVSELSDRCAALSIRARQEGIELRLVSGGEVALGWALEADDDELALASYGQRGTDLLIETPQINTVGLETALHAVRVRGYRITLAHPERSGEFQQDVSRLSALVDQGILLQINADTLLGDTRKSRTCRLARRLCADGLAHVLASDAHRGVTWRPVTNLVHGVEAAAALVGAERAEWMASSAPAAVIEGRELPAAPPLVPQQRKGRLWPWR